MNLDPGYQNLRKLSFLFIEMDQLTNGNRIKLGMGRGIIMQKQQISNNNNLNQKKHNFVL